MVRGKIITSIVGALLCVAGAALISGNTKSEAAIVAESEAYVPHCNGQAMSPGDMCIRYGNGAKSQSYDEMVADHTPDKLRSSHAAGRNFGIGVASAGGLLLVIVVLTVIGALRRTSPRRRQVVPAPSG